MGGLYALLSRFGDPYPLFPGESLCGDPYPLFEEGLGCDGDAYPMLPRCLSCAGDVYSLFPDCLGGGGTRAGWTIGCCPFITGFELLKAF